MEIQRTANAGILLKLDGVSILLDGLCDGVEGYLPTPKSVAESIFAQQPDLLAFTHKHPDHCSEALLLPYRKQNLRPILGPEYLPVRAVSVGDVKITPVASRHLGRTEPGLQHHSFIIEGSRCVWFMGDAAPLQFKDRSDLPKADVLIAPFAYANTKAAWELACSLAERVVLLHLPDRDNDPFGMWQTVNTMTAGSNIRLWIPEIGQTVTID